MKGITVKSPRVMVMLVTSEGLTDPRVRRSMHSAQRLGIAVHLVCRAPSPDQAGYEDSGTISIHRVARPWGWSRLSRLIARLARAPEAVPRDQSRARRFWIRPWELWVLGGMLWFTCQAVRHVIRVPADLYHANDLDTLPAGAILSRFNKAPLLYDAHELYCEQFHGMSRQFRALLFGLEHWLIRSARKVVTVNYSLASVLESWHAVSPPSVVMNCPSAADLGETKAQGDTDPHGLSNSRRARVIYQGIFWHDRGLEELIRSAAGFEAAELYLRGFGALEPRLRALVQAEGLQGRVHFLPPAHPERLVEALADFDVGVVPYRPVNLNNRFCLPNKVFEYLQAGLALATSALPELERVIKDTEAGEVFDPEQPRDIACAINALTKDAGRLQQMKDRARKAAGRYVWEVQGEPQLIACYRELIVPGSAGKGRDR